MYIFRLKSSVFLIILALGIQSCYKEKYHAKSLVEEWYQKEILIPKNFKFKSLGRDTICLHILKHKFKVLVYIDSLGCTACKLNLFEWKGYIDTCQFKYYDVGFLFVVQSKNYRAFELRLKESHFTYPIIYDLKNEYNKLNQFPKDDKYRTFLLDEKYRVILIGSPINNDKLSKLYTEVLGGRKKPRANSSEKIESENFSTTTVQLNRDSVNLGIFSSKTTKLVNFQLKNTGKQPLILQALNTSCGCTIAKYDKKPVAQGETTTVILEYKPNSLGYFSKTADVVCNVPEGFVRLTISGEVVEK